jgi:hypothetical protein
MTESNEEAQLKAASREAAAALKAYVADVAQEREHAGKARVSRESAIANAIRFGATLAKGRAIHATDDNAFNGWIKHTGLDLTPPFDDRRERSAAMQMAKLAGDGSPVAPFAGCTNSRPTDCMKWFRAQQEEAEIAKLDEEWERNLRAKWERDAQQKAESSAWLRPKTPEQRAAEEQEKAAREAEFEALRQAERDRLIAEHRTRREQRQRRAERDAGRDADEPQNVVPGWLKPRPEKDPDEARPPIVLAVQARADNAEIATLKKELWTAHDKLDQLMMYLVEKPQPKAEDRPFDRRDWPFKIRGARPKETGPRQIVGLSKEAQNDPAFALRREEFEQWLVRRKEELEAKYMAREIERDTMFDAKLKAAVETRIAKEAGRGRVFTEKQFNAIVRVLHADSRKSASEKDLNAAFDLVWKARDRLIVRDKKPTLREAMAEREAKKAAEAAGQPAPAPPREEEPDPEAVAEALAHVRRETRH